MCYGRECTSLLLLNSNRVRLHSIGAQYWKNAAGYERIIWGKFICVLGELDPSMIYWFSKVGRTARTWCRGAARNSTAMTGKKLELEERTVQRYLANVDSVTCCSKSVASKLKAQNEMSGTQLWNCQCAVHVCNLYWVSRILVDSNLFYSDRSIVSGKQEVSDTQEIEGSLPEYSSSGASVQKLKWIIPDPS